MTSIDKLVEQAPVYDATKSLSEGWPGPLDEAAFHGLAGRVVETISPHTEADKAALLLNFLTYYGNAVGNVPHAVAEGAKHGTNLFVCIVGATSKGRKGSANSHIRKLFNTVLPEWESTCVKSGLSSGEGLIFHVRDSTYKTNKKEEVELVEQGIDDKRLLVIESEFASPLRVMNREGNVLSATLRQAWDSGTMTQLIKNNPTKATDAHISLIGHISKEELLRYLKDVEQANGFANRFIWCCSKRERLLPEGGGTPPYHELGAQLLESVETAQSPGLMERDESAKALWADVYEDLSTGKPGLSGAVLNRAEAQVLRLSVLYAAIDGTKQINLTHLKAALAVWEYSEASSEFIFGKSSGSAHGEKLLGALKETPSGMSRTAISALFNRNVSSDVLDSSLALLQRQGVVEKQVIQTEGRPAEVWVAKSP
ncbi:MAG: hypothetical protein QF530_04055 [SAR202 cluster bacterium]|jgi:hypothetical protein|nr:hypothetical protein [SAR202 cluster bacterium]|tara:strand:- start:488 stop:1768 length:1281 start_codon:yes stop_codon:yes gene_type:complete